MHLPPPVPGRVYLVGAGPGDPGLFTLKGAQYLAAADVVLYDEYLDHRLLELTSADCEKIYVGKRGGGKSASQDSINQMLIEQARKKRRVVRLKGGDPFIYGRGGEEAQALKAAGISFEVVSGVTAAAAAPASAGIPLTHRDLASTAILVTGHEDPTKANPSVDWEKLAGLKGTLVIFMGVGKLKNIVATLVKYGRPPDQPAALIERGTWPHQRTVIASLRQLPEKAAAAGLRPPALIVVGAVVGLNDQLNWFESRPLFGRRALITRSRHQAGSLQLALEAEGAQVDVLPLLELGPANDPAPLRGVGIARTACGARRSQTLARPSVPVVTIQRPSLL